VLQRLLESQPLGLGKLNGGRIAKGNYLDDDGRKKTATRTTSATAMITTVTIAEAI